MSDTNEADFDAHTPANAQSKTRADVAAQVVGAEAQNYDHTVERGIIRKIDLWVIPFLWFGYGLVYYDKAILGGASIFGMITSLELRVVVDNSVVPPITSTQRLSWASSIFYFGMLAGVMPLTYAFQRFHLSRVIGAAVVIWGLCCMSTALVTDHRGLYVQRFFLGFLESIMPTAFMVIVSSFYTQREQTWRQCLWYSATGAWTIIGAGFNYAFASITSGSLERWQYLYIMAGSMTVVYGLGFFLFPQTPNDAFFLRGDEKRISMERLRQSHMGVRCNTIKWDQIREALTDPKVYLISLMMGLAYTGTHHNHFPPNLQTHTKLTSIPSSQWRSLRFRPPNCQHLRLRPLHRPPLANAARRRLPRHDPRLRLRQPALQEHPPDHARARLPARHGRLRHDLERRVERRRRDAARGLHADWILCAGDEFDREHGDGECGGEFEEEFHGEWDVCYVLCR